MIYVLAAIIFAIICFINYSLNTMYEDVAERQKSGAKAKKFDTTKCIMGLIVMGGSLIFQIWLIGHGLIHLGLKF